MSVHRYSATWTVDTGPGEDSALKLLPIAPKRLIEVFGAVVRKLLDVAGEVEVRVGAVSVTCQQDPAGVSGPSPESPAAGTTPPAPARDHPRQRRRTGARDPDRQPTGEDR